MRKIFSEVEIQCLSLHAIECPVPSKIQIYKAFMTNSPCHFRSFIAERWTRNKRDKSPFETLLKRFVSSEKIAVGRLPRPPYRFQVEIFFSGVFITKFLTAFLYNGVLLTFLLIMYKLRWNVNINLGSSSLAMKDNPNYRSSISFHRIRTIPSPSVVLQFLKGVFRSVNCYAIIGQRI